jgi:hypothetical protein
MYTVIMCVFIALLWTTVQTISFNVWQRSTINDDSYDATNVGVGREGEVERFRRSM